MKIGLLIFEKFPPENHNLEGMNVLLAVQHQNLNHEIYYFRCLKGFAMKWPLSAKKEGV